MNTVRAQLAAYIGASEDDLVFIPNASDGVNTVLRSLQPPVGQKILLLNTAYGMVGVREWGLPVLGGGCVAWWV
jgi:isopenicillin-N epimerase